MSSEERSVAAVVLHVHAPLCSGCVSMAADMKGGEEQWVGLHDECLVSW